MAKQTINIGTAPNDGTGDPVRAAFTKVNENFTECYDNNSTTQSDLDIAEAALAGHIGSGGAAHADATTSVDGFMTAADKVKLNGIATGATQNQTDAFLLARGNATGTQLSSTISDLATTIASAIAASNINNLNDVVISSPSNGQVLTYNGTNWVNSAGGGGSDPWTWVKLTSDVSNSATALADVTGLSFTALANTTYIVEVIGTFQSAAITTGIALALNIPSGTVTGQIRANISATAINSLEQIANDATTSVSTATRAVATNTPITAKFIVAVGGTGGTVALRFRSEVAASAVTMKADVTALGYRTI